jgi:hypothetical protein
VTTINQLRLKHRVVNSLPAAIANILLAYIFLGLFGPDQGGTLPEGPGGLYLVGAEGRDGLVPAPNLGIETAVDVAISSSERLWVLWSMGRLLVEGLEAGAVRAAARGA